MKICLRIFFSAILSTSASPTGSDAFSDIARRGELVVSTLNSPHTYYSDRSGPNGFEYALAKKFAESLGVKIKVIVAPNSSAALRLLDTGLADIAALGTKIPGAPNFFHSETQPHTLANFLVVYKSGNSKPRKLSDLQDSKISANTETWPVSLVTEFAEMNSLISTPNATTKNLLDSIQAGVTEIAIVNANEFKLLQKLYPQLKEAFVIEGVQIPIGWYVKNTSSGKILTRLADHYIDKANRRGVIDSLRNDTFFTLSNFSNADAYTFERRIQKRLPYYKDVIYQVAEEFGLEWELLAAISYQESHWNPLATSPTGVRGMMMLTRRTAAELGVSKRTDIRQSLRGGAEYFLALHSRLPFDIPEPHRTSFALAAYNVGLGHLEDARVLTEKMGADPHYWEDVGKYLPYLQVEKYYKKTKHGFAKGKEAVTYVTNIQNYYQTLIWRGLVDRASKIDSSDLQVALLPNSITGKSWSAL